ncbi:MAG: hypothetical protein LBL98_04340 [Ruminococcus sp.]|nr:hypothetical protein [Ruminococcus sp.]
MKRILLITTVLITLLILTVTGCDKLKNSIAGGVNIADTPFTARMEIDTEEVDFIANVKRLGMGLWEMEVLEPSHIKGLVITYDGSSVSSTMNGFTQTQPVENIAQSAVFLQIFRAIDNAISDIDPKGETVDGKYVLDGDNYSITFNPETDAPEELKLPDSVIEAYISEFQVTA